MEGMNVRFQPRYLAIIAMLILTIGSQAMQGRRGRDRNTSGTDVREMTQILGRPTDRSIVLSILTPSDMEIFVEYGVKTGMYTEKTPVANTRAGKPLELEIDQLTPGARYDYRLRYRQSGSDKYLEGAENTFQTQRPPGSTFIFSVQGDSHPERLGRMFDPDLYLRTMENIRKDCPDFHVLLGDDFSIDNLYNQNRLNAATVSQLYIYQRRFLSIPGSSSPLFLVNGNHEHAARCLLDGTPNNPAVLSGRARNLYFPLPAPDHFYSGDKEPIEFVGLPRDYYSWTWGDALFIVLDPYWHSPVQIDAALGGEGAKGKGRLNRKEERAGNHKNSAGNRDGWSQTIGDAQYQWFRKTLEQSKARWKFVFAHHVLGTGRGGIERSDFYEWGGKAPSGQSAFNKMRPGWELPIHQLMVKYGVTIFFQGHDHLFARQEKDGVVYQETPNPADPGYDDYYREAYLSGDVMPNSGHLRVTVARENVNVDYVRSYLPKDENSSRKNGRIDFSYRILANAN
jgi:hypothetical protein